jgi:hypothetical protein
VNPELAGQLTIGVLGVLTVILQIRSVRSPGRARARIRQDLDLLNALPADSAARKEWADYIDLRLHALLRREKATRRAPELVILGLLFVGAALPPTYLLVGAALGWPLPQVLKSNALDGWIINPADRSVAASTMLVLYFVSGFALIALGRRGVRVGVYRRILRFPAVVVRLWRMTPAARRPARLSPLADAEQPGDTTLGQGTRSDGAATSLKPNTSEASPTWPAP